MNPSNKFFPMFIALTLISTTVSAQNPDTEITALREQLMALSARLDALESANRELKADNQRLQETHEAEHEMARPSKASWADRISLKGDVRARYENIDEQGRDSRNRDRVRARASIIAKVSDQVEVGLGIASGSDDPVSTNQTLGNGGSTKGLNLDLAYIKWSLAGNSTVYGGKFKNHLFKPGGNGLLWDGDWTPEGVGFAWENDDFFVNGIGTWLESDSRNGAEFSTGIQAGLVRTLGNDVKLTAGAAFYNFGTAGKGTFYGDSDDFFGNSFNPVTETYLYDYRMTELFADLEFSIYGKPAGVFVDYVRNQDAGEFDTAYAAGFNYGSNKNAGDWQWGYVYQDIEADAVFGLLADSDFAGGGSDGSGHILKGGYTIGKNISTNFTYFMNERNANAGSKRDYDRLQVDLSVKY